MKMLNSQYISTNGIQLHCKVGGEGPLMIMLHGFPEFWYSWRKQIPALLPHFKLVIPDMRGYNKSDRPKGVKNYQLSALVADIKGLIQHFVNEKAIIVGHDWGGAVSWALSYEEPALVEKLIILNMPHPYEMWRNVLTNFEQTKRSYYIFLFQFPGIAEYGINADLQSFFLRSLRDWSHNKDAFTDEDIAHYIKAFADPSAMTAAINYYRASSRYLKMWLNGKKKKVQCPVLMIWGEDDKALGKELTYTTPRYCANRVFTKYIPNCSHWVQHEYPDIVNQEILAFLK